MTHTPNINYCVKGEGRPVLFIHGWSASGDIWARQIKFFSPRFKVITVDLRGHGKSDWIHEDDIFKALAEDIFNLCNKMDLKSVNIVGWSLGAMLILKWVELFDLRRINSITLVCPTPRFLSDETFQHGVSEALLRTLTVNLRKDYDVTIKAFYKFLFSDVNISEERFNWAWDKVIKKSLLARKEALMHILRSFRHFDARSVLHKINVPTLIIACLRDTVCNPRAAHFINDNIPASKLVALDSGHVPFLTHTDEFNKAVNDFLVSVP